MKFRVSPNAGRIAIEGLYEDDAIRLRAAAPPADGKANAEVQCFESDLFGKKDVQIVRGTKCRDEVVFVRRVGREEAERILSGQIR